MDSVVHERCEILLVDRVPDSQLCRDPTIEVLEDVEAVGALGRRGQPEQLPWLQVVEQRLVARRGGVVELVDDHDVEVAWINSVNAGGGQTLDRRKDMFESRGALPANPHLPECRVTHSELEGAATLFEDLLAVRDEQQPVSTSDGLSRA